METPEVLEKSHFHDDSTTRQNHVIDENVHLTSQLHRRVIATDTSEAQINVVPK